MKVGVFIPSTDETIAVPTLARRVEALGFESFWAPEHPAVPGRLDSQIPEPGTMPDFFRKIMDPFLCLAAAAAVTERIRLGTAVCLVPERHPLLTAKQVATLDVMSGGRFEFGVGAGWIRGEGEALGTDWKRRWRQTQDYILAMKACWTASPATHQGSHATFTDMVVEPKPRQRPHPPVLIAGELERSAERVAAFGDGWIPRFTELNGPAAIEAGRRKIEALYSERGRDPATLTVTLFGCNPKRELHRDFGNAGVDRIIQVLRISSPEQTLERLDIWAGELL